MKLKNYLKSVDCNQPVVLYINGQIVENRCAYFLFNNNKYENYEVIKVKAKESMLYIDISNKSSEIEKCVDNVISFFGGATPVTISQFKDTIDNLLDELEKKDYNETDYISIVCVGSAYHDGEDNKSNNTLIKIDLY